MFRLPDRKNIESVDPRAEPTRYYYWPGVGWFYRKRLRMILDLLGARRFDSLLDVGYGSGIFLPSLATVSDTLSGIDLHDKIDVVEKTLAKESLQADLTSGSALDMPYKNETFDCVVSVSLLEHVTDPGAVIDEMLRILRPGGVLALGFPCRNFAMDTFFRAVGFNPREIHPSSHSDILDALGKRRSEVTLQVLPGFVPIDLALYCACLATK